MQRLLVYGTLRQGNGNDHLLISGGARFIEEVWLLGHAMFDTLCVRKADPEDRVRGEIWEVPVETLLGPIDDLEGHPFIWERTWIPDQHDGIWVYLYKQGSRFDRKQIDANYKPRSYIPNRDEPDWAKWSRQDWVDYYNGIFDRGDALANEDGIFTGEEDETELEDPFE